MAAKHLSDEKGQSPFVAVTKGDSPFSSSVFVRYTLRSLAANRVRTAVSVIGVALSVALIAAVLTSVVSLSDMLVRRTAADEGWWYAEATEITEQGLDLLEGDPEVTDRATVTELGTVSLGEENSSLFGPYLYAKTWPAATGDEPLLQAPELVAGHAPEAPGEVVLPHYLQNAELAPCGVETADGGAIQLGSQIALDLGTRTVENLVDGSTYTATSLNGSYVDEATQHESFSADLGRMEVTVVGFYRSYGYSSTYAIQGNSAYVYDDGSALEGALSDGSEATWVSAVFRTADPAEAADVAQELANTDGVGTSVHNSLLRWMGATPDTAIWNTLYQIAGILAAVVVVAGVSLVYNSFAISVAERTRQFGLLSSLGASRRQLRRTVLVEALLIGAAGVPTGLLLGLAGCYVVFGLVGDGLAALAGGGSAATVVVSPVALLLAALLGIVTLLASAWVPALRASRVSAVDAIRQTQDVRLGRRARRTSHSKLPATRHGSLTTRSLGLAGRLFGVPGFVAHRNLSRSSSKGRVTVTALAVSCALLITSGSIADVMGYATDTSVDTAAGQDLVLYLDATGAEADQTLALADGKVDGPGMQAALASFYGDVRGVEGAHANGYATSYVAEVLLPAGMATDDMAGLEGSYTHLSDGSWYGQAYVAFLDDTSWAAYVDGLGLSRDEFCDPAHPRAVAVSAYNIKGGEKYARLAPLAAPGTLTSLEFADLDDRFVAGLRDGADGTPEAYYYDDSGNKQALPLDQAVAREEQIEVGALAEQAPVGVSLNGSLQLILSASAIQLADTMGYLRASCSLSTDGDAARAADAQDEIEKIAADHPGLDVTYFNVAEDNLQHRLMATAVNTFIYCFAAITGLIAVTNVFNTLANALILRRREFAVLRSIGMDGHAFRRMIAYECASYALRGLALGFALALVSNVGLYEAMALSYSTYEFALPWPQIGLSVVAVLAVIAVSVTYALRRCGAAGVLEALRSDVM